MLGWLAAWAGWAGWIAGWLAGWLRELDGLGWLEVIHLISCCVEKSKLVVQKINCYLAAVLVTKMFAVDVCIFEAILQNEIWPFGVQSRIQGVAFKNKKLFGCGFIDTKHRTPVWCVSVSS